MAVGHGWSSPGLVLVLVLLLVRFSILVLLIPVRSVWIPPQPWHEGDAKEEEEQAGAAGIVFRDSAYRSS